jgi:hypothetical protein
LVESDTPIWLQIIKTRTLHHVSSGYQPCHNPVDLTTKANLCCESKNTTKNKIKCNSIEVIIADEWLSTRSWGLANRKMTSVNGQNNLSKTQTLT